MTFDPTVVALLGTIFGGVGLKITEYFLSKGSVRVDHAANIRDELRLEIVALRTENATVEKERDKWREDYYDMYKKYIGVITDLQILKGDYDREEEEPS